MAKQDKDTLYVIAAAYDDVDAAVADYEAVKELYRAVRSSHDFDASVVAKNETARSASSRSTSSRPGTVRRSGSAGAWPWVSWRSCSRPPGSAWPPLGPVVRPSARWPGT
jgi:hypothetical protein